MVDSGPHRTRPDSASGRPPTRPKRPAEEAPLWTLSLIYEPGIRRARSERLRRGRGTHEPAISVPSDDAWGRVTASAAWRYERKSSQISGPASPLIRACNASR